MFFIFGLKKYNLYFILRLLSITFENIWKTMNDEYFYLVTFFILSFTVLSPRRTIQENNFPKSGFIQHLSKTLWEEYEIKESI